MCQQEWLALLFTILGVALATAEFITADVVADILQLIWGISITEETVGVLVLLPVAGQLLIMAIIGYIAWVVVARWQRRGPW
jgi:membrane protein implicated in regulation of membrane protease activity